MTDITNSKNRCEEINIFYNIGSLQMKGPQLLVLINNCRNLEFNKQKKNMSNQRETDRLIFESSKHHKQLLRSQIDPRLIDRIEIDRNPSLNYMNAYKSLYRDSLENTVRLQEEKKHKQRHLTQEDQMMYCVGMKEQRPSMNDTSNISHSQLSRYGKMYVDYDEEKTLKCQDHIKKNYDGGQAFYKSHDQHLERKQQQAFNTRQTLNNQLRFNQFSRLKQEQNKNQQNQSFRELKYRQWLDEQKRQKEQKVNQMNFRHDIVKQIEEEHERKNKKSYFDYQNVARHNPITNPIEYHIDNPYILKQIQNRNAYKNQNVYPNVRY